MGWSISAGTGGQFKLKWGGQFHRIFQVNIEGKNCTVKSPSSISGPEIAKRKRNKCRRLPDIIMRSISIKIRHYAVEFVFRLMRNCKYTRIGHPKKAA
jgi:hypothetical protein